MQLPVDPNSVRGFLHTEEGERLYDLALSAAAMGPCLEIGSYCGKSSVYLGAACQQRDQILYALDHHRGSEEHQPGEEYHDPELFDARQARLDSLPEFRATIARAGLETTVIPLVTTSVLAGRHWLNRERFFYRSCL